MEGEAHGFRVVVVQPGEQDWTEKVLKAAAKLEKSADT
jgi:hypothetical protein